MEEVLAQKPDFISICSPIETHLKHIRALLPSGAFLFVEKPLFWLPDLTRDAVKSLAEELFRESQGRLAVNHPMRWVAASFAEQTAWREPVRKLSFRYHTKGKHSGDMIAVDLLPHALSMLLALSALSRARVDDPRHVMIDQTDSTWRLEAIFGDVACKFDFLQNRELSASVMSFDVNGVAVVREQVIAGSGMRVLLAFDTRRIEIPNPMTTAIERAVSASRSGKAMPGEADFSTRIMSMMADLLLSVPQR